MNLDRLRQELIDDPEEIGYGPALHAADDAELARRLNRSDRPGGVAVLNTRQLLEWAAANGRYERIEAAAGNASDASGVRSIAKVALAMLTRADAVIDLANAEHLALLNGLVVANVISLSDKQSLVGKAAVLQSRAEELFGRGTTIAAADAGAAR